MKQVPVLLFLVLISCLFLSACVSPSTTASQVSPASQPSPSPTLTTVRVAFLPTTSFGPIYIAKDEGYFARQGIDVELVKFSDVATSLPLLLNGDIGVSGGQVTSGMINVVTKGQHVRVVADKGRVTPDSCTVYALMVRKDLYDKGLVTNVSELKGRKIMGNSGEQSYGVVSALALGNLTLDDVTLVSMDYPSAMVAFRNGALDAGLVTEPYITQAVTNGSAVVLVPGGEFIADWPIPLYYGPVLLDKDPDLGRRFMVAYLQGVRQYNEGKTPRNLAIMANYTRLSPALLNQSCWYPIAADGRVPWKPIGSFMDWLYEKKMITQKANESQVFDMSYVTYANGVLANTTPGGK